LAGGAAAGGGGGSGASPPFAPLSKKAADAPALSPSLLAPDASPDA
jgi:hypothetical protein